MKVSDNSQTLLDFLNNQPAKTASKQTIIKEMSRVGVSTSAAIEFLLRYMITANLITHHVATIKNHKQHTYTAL